MRLPSPFYTLLTLAFLLTFSLSVIFQLPLAAMLPLGKHGISITDLNRSSLASGEVYLRAEGSGLRSLAHARWHWCPGWQPLTWCLDLETADLQFSGRVTMGLQSGELTDASLRLASLRALGLDPGLVAVRGTLSIARLKVGDLRCPLRHIERLSAHAELNQISVLGAPLGQVRIDANGRDGRTETRIEGDHLRGTLAVYATDGFSGNLELSPPPGYGELLSQFASPNPQGVYQWQLSGQLPCLVT